MSSTSLSVQNVIIDIFKCRQSVNRDFRKSSGKEYTYFPLGLSRLLLKMSNSGKDEGCAGRIPFRKQEEVLDSVGIVWDKTTGRVHPDRKSQVSQNYSSTPLVRGRFLWKASQSLSSLNLGLPFHVLLALCE